MTGNPLINLPASFPDFDIWQVNPAYKDIQRKLAVFCLAREFGLGIMTVHAESSNLGLVIFRKPITSFN